MPGACLSSILVLKPHEKYAIKKYLNIYALDGYRIGNEAGIYRIKFVYSISDYCKNINKKFPDLIYEPKWESPEKEIIVEEPKGIDLEVLRAAENKLKKLPKEKTNSGYKPSACSFLNDIMFILRNYPTSTYAAWAWTENNLYDYSEIKVQDAIDEIKADNFLQREAWDPNSSRVDGFGYATRLMRSDKEMALWEKEKYNFILKYHPDFKVKNIKLQLALDELILNEEEGIKKLEDFIREEEIEAGKLNKPISIEGIWAKEFLSLWLMQKKK